ncbi:MAG: Na+/H+ antiporter subunit E [Solirubrobacteraceae bacterium]
MSRRRAVLAWLGWYATLLALYLALADSRRPEELVAGAAVAAFGTAVAMLVRREREVLLAPTPAMAFELVRAVGRVPGDLVLLAHVLVRRSAPRARTVKVPFEAVGRDPHDGAARAIGVIAGSLSPNSVVIKVDEEARALLVHRLVDEP